MIINLGKPRNFLRTWSVNKMYKEDYPLSLGAYYSKTKPLDSDSTSDEEVEFDTEKDSILASYNVDVVYVWKNEKPIQVAGFHDFYDQGTAISFHSDVPGYFTICSEND